MARRMSLTGAHVEDRRVVDGVESLERRRRADERSAC